MTSYHDYGVVQLVISQCEGSIKKTYKGPYGAVDRLTRWHNGQLKPFGENVSKYSTTIEPEIYLELAGKKASNNDEFIHNGLYITHAKQLNWSKERISKIIKTNRPDLVFKKYYVMDYPSTAPSTLMSTSTAPSTTPSTSTSTSTSTEATKPKLGLAARMKLVREQASDNNEPKSQGFGNRFKEKYQTDNDESVCTIFVSNLPSTYEEIDIKEHFMTTDIAIRRVNVVRYDQEHGGKAFIVCSRGEDVERCIEYLNSCRWGNAIIHADKAKSKNRKKQS